MAGFEVTLIGRFWVIPEELSPQVIALLSQNMQDSNGRELDSGVSGYKQFSDLVGQYLKQAVVPSTVFDGKDHWYPDTVALLNASMRFYLESLEELIDGIKGQKTFLAGHRSKWIKRVESLTAKAIEDHHFLVGEKGALQDGGAFKRADRGSLESANN